LVSEVRTPGFRPPGLADRTSNRKEQKTRQCPAFGRKSWPQLVQSKKNWQPSVGMVSGFAVPLQLAGAAPPFHPTQPIPISRADGSFMICN
jgi:hypothetical protein